MAKKSDRTDGGVITAIEDAGGRSERRSPGRQMRSRERVDQILSVAEELISAHGYNGLKMREVARIADLPIASIYHYFPSNAAILRTLTERHLKELRIVIAANLDSYLNLDLPTQDVPTAVKLVVRAVADHLRASPSTTALWDALRAIPELRTLDIADTTATARLLAPYISRAAPGIAADRIGDFSAIFVVAMQSNLTVIMHNPRDRQKRLIDALEDFAATAIRGLQATVADS
jgi:AcrR family transcriptional regulator